MLVNKTSFYKGFLGGIESHKAIAAYKLFQARGRYKRYRCEVI